ncbi:MAG: hypothetical protein DCC75_05080 [Proteobacteria bacterium]|nr:MAG: hypothetical protein DCC75_05080 [Pseudomonadota bacterium]
MKQRCIKLPSPAGRSARDEQGIYLVLMAGILVSVLLLVGLAIDSANLYRAQLRTQRAVDAAAVGATYLFGSQTSAAIEDTARNIARNNFMLMNLDNYLVNVSSTSNSLTVEGFLTVPLYILSMFPAIGDSRQVRAIASAETVRTMVSLVLDTTGSMNCPDSVACSDSCIGGDTTACPVGMPSKLQRLKEAAVAFVNSLDESRDKIALVTFSNNASTKKAMISTFNKSTLNAKIMGLTANGETNIQAGVKRGQYEIDTLSGLTGYRKVLVLVTDGAPNRSDESISLPGCAVSSNRKHYIRAIGEANSARTQNTTVYTLGLGQIVPEENDPYQFQDEGDLSALKSYFLKRLANSPEGSPDPNFDCVPSYEDYNSTPGISKGTYLGSPDSSQLQNMLLSVSKSIKVRVTQ